MVYNCAFLFPLQEHYTCTEPTSYSKRREGITPLHAHYHRYEGRGLETDVDCMHMEEMS